MSCLLRSCSQLLHAGLSRRFRQLDLELTRDAAPLLAFDNLTEHDFYSARIGCQTFGIYGMDLAALCIKPARR